MAIDRRQFLAAAAAMGAAIPAVASPAPKPPLLSALGLDAAHLGLRAGSPDDQSMALQRAVDQAAAAQAPLALGPGTYRAADVTLPAGAQIVAPRGMARIIATRGRPIFTAANADRVTLSGLVLDGGRTRLQEGGLVTLRNGRLAKIIDCEIVNSGGHGIRLDGDSPVVDSMASCLTASPARFPAPSSATPPTSPFCPMTRAASPSPAISCARPATTAFRFCATLPARTAP